jgi:hypothetical protein
MGSASGTASVSRLIGPVSPALRRDPHQGGLRRGEVRADPHGATVLASTDEGGAVPTRPIRQVVANAIAMMAVLGIVFGAVTRHYADNVVVFAEPV